MVYVARKSIDGTIRIYPAGRPQTCPVATLRPRPGTRLRDTLEAAGWTPTGGRGSGGRAGAIYVTRRPRRRQ